MSPLQLSSRLLFNVTSNTNCLCDAIAILALSSPIQAINHALPLIQQRTENTATTVRAMHNELHSSRREAQEYRKGVLQEMTDLANRANRSSRSPDTAITITLDSYSAEMNKLRHDLEVSQSQHAGEVIAKLEAMVGNIE